MLGRREGMLFTHETETDIRRKDGVLLPRVSHNTIYEGVDAYSTLLDTCMKMKKSDTFLMVQATTTSEVRSSSQPKTSIYSLATLLSIETPTDRWIRFQVEAEDLVVIPVGIYHRFTLDEGDYIKSVRLFRADPKWVYMYRSKEMDVNPYRLTYVKETKQKLGIPTEVGWGAWLWSWVTWSKVQ